MNDATIQFKNNRLGGYLLGGLGAMTAVATQQADAALTAFVFTPSVISPSTGYSLNSNGSFGDVPTNGSYAEGGTIFIGNAYNSYSYGPGPTIGLASFFAPGTVIGGGGNGVLGIASFAGAYSGPGRTYATDQQGYIAFKTSTNHYGFANVTWVAATQTLTINSASVESTPNTPITIVPEPSVAGLLALGAIAAARTRRRAKTAA